MAVRSGHRRTRDGDLDLDDPAVWRVDQYLPAVMKAVADSYVYAGMPEGMIKRGLRAVADSADHAYRWQRDNPDEMEVPAVDRPSRIKALDAAIKGIDKALAGLARLAAQGAQGEGEGSGERDSLVASLEMRRLELSKIREKLKAAPKAVPFTNDPALWSAVIALWGVLYLLNSNGLTDRAMLNRIAEAAWMDAGLIDPSNALKGGTLRTWLANYRKRQETRWK